MMGGKCNKLSDDEEKQWLDYAGSIFGSYAAVKMYETALNKTVCYSLAEIEEVIEFYLNNTSLPEVASIGLYACARHLEVKEPMLCYELTEAAFALNPDLAKVLGVSYHYKGKAAEEDLTEECPFCGSGGQHLIPYYCSPQVMKLANHTEFSPAKLWVKCDKCGNFFSYNFPKSRVSLINGHYTKNNEEIINNKFLLDCYSRIFNRFRTLTKGNDYLEIGVGTGEMLAVAQEFGYHVEAVEICQSDCERISAALGIDIKWCDILNHETDKQYDVIVMGDVLEHVIEPVSLLKKVKGMLKNGGVLWISTPNYNSAYARMQKFSHCMWHELNHYTYVSYESLKCLLEDLQMKVIRYDMSTRYIGSMELCVMHAE